MGVWTGGSSESWFDYDKLSRYRLLVNPETHSKIESGSKAFYLISVDVGRLSCQTVVTVFKVYPREDGYFCNVVNIYVIGRTEETKHFERQALDLKKIIAAFNPREIVIDGNGLGVGLLDFMAKPTTDIDGVVYPAYCPFNDDDYKVFRTKDSVNNVYCIKANSTLNSQIHSHCYTKIFSGRVKFLIKEQEAKNKLLSTKVGQKLSVESRIVRLMPHEMTTKLFEEMANLRLKKTGNGMDINLEQINTRYLKDKFSSLEYGLWRIKEIEEEEKKSWRKRANATRKLVFYTRGG